MNPARTLEQMSADATSEVLFVMLNLNLTQIIYSDTFCDGKGHNGDNVVIADDLSKKLFVKKCGNKYEEDLYTPEMCRHENCACWFLKHNFGLLLVPQNDA